MKITPLIKDRLFKERGRICEDCGTHLRIEVHHKDLNPENNSLDNLKVLCEKHHTEEHKKIGKIIRDSQLGYGKRIVLDIPDDLHALIKIQAAKEARSIREILLELVQRWLKRK